METCFHSVAAFVPALLPSTAVSGNKAATGRQQRGNMWSLCCRPGEPRRNSSRYCVSDWESGSSTKPRTSIRTLVSIRIDLCIPNSSPNAARGCDGDKNNLGMNPASATTAALMGPLRRKRSSLRCGRFRPQLRSSLLTKREQSGKNLPVNRQKLRFPVDRAKRCGGKVPSRRRRLRQYRCPEMGLDANLLNSLRGSRKRNGSVPASTPQR
jgi:hypothetical protein